VLPADDVEFEEPVEVAVLAVLVAPVEPVVSVVEFELPPELPTWMLTSQPAVSSDAASKMPVPTPTVIDLGRMTCSLQLSAALLKRSLTCGDSTAMHAHQACLA
jgi:hypothetical protein